MADHVLCATARAERRSVGHSYPSLLVALMSAPAKMRAAAASTWPFFAANMSAVHLSPTVGLADGCVCSCCARPTARRHPSVFLAARSAPAATSSSSTSTWRVWPLNAAHMSAVFLRHRPPLCAVGWHAHKPPVAGPESILGLDVGACGDQQLDCAGATVHCRTEERCQTTAPSSASQTSLSTNGSKTRE